MELYANYCKEMYGRDIITDEYGFIVYTAFEDDSLYIHSVYVTEEKRGTNYYTYLEDKVISKEEPTSIFCYVDLTTKNPTQSLKAILKAGYEIVDSNKESLMLKREIDENIYNRSVDSKQLFK